MNENNFKDFDLLNNFNNFNMKTLKLTEIKLHINNILISKFNMYAHQVYNEIKDIDMRPIKKINLLNLENIDIEFYSSINGYFNEKSCIKIFIYSNLYLQKNKPLIEKEIIIDKIDDIIIDTSSINNEPSTKLEEDELNIIEWLNN